MLTTISSVWKMTARLCRRGSQKYITSAQICMYELIYSCSVEYGSYLIDHSIHSAKISDVISLCHRAAKPIRWPQTFRPPRRTNIPAGAHCNNRAVAHAHTHTHITHIDSHIYSMRAHARCAQTAHTHHAQSVSACYNFQSTDHTIRPHALLICKVCVSV